MAQLVAVREGVNAVVTGSITQDGSGYKVYVTTLDPASGKTILSEQRSASNKQDVLAAAGKLAESIRKGLGDTTPESAQQSAAETFSAGSLEAAHAYAVGQDFQQAAKWDDALKAYAQAVELDPNLGAPTPAWRPSTRISENARTPKNITDWRCRTSTA